MWWGALIGVGTAILVMVVFFVGVCCGYALRDSRGK